MKPVELALRVAGLLEALNIDYLVGGSLASSFTGQPRSTMDIDLVVRLEESQVPRLVDALESEFHVDSKSLMRAARERSSANIFHASSAFKVDFFVLGSSEAEEEQMRRRRRVRVMTDPDRFLYTYTPEDIVLQKLRWYRMGGGVSERQWDDVISVIRTSGSALDRAYLDRAAAEFGVIDLLKRAIGEAT